MLIKGLGLAVAGVAITFVCDALVATRRAQMIQALLRPGMLPREVVMAIGPRASVLDAQGCMGDATPNCRHIRLAVRGLLVATYTFEAVMGPDGRVSSILQRGPIWAEGRRPD